MMTYKEFVAKRLNENMDMICDDIAERLQLAHCKIVSMVKSKRRAKNYVDLRQEVAKRLREYGHTYPDIAKALNMKCHTSVMHLIKNRGRND